MYRIASSDVEVADDKVGQLFLVRVGDFNAFVGFHLALGWRPVLNAHHLLILRVNGRRRCQLLRIE